MKVLFLFCLFSLSLVSAQTTWERTYGGDNEDMGNSVMQTSDGGYIVAGVTWSFGAGMADVYLFKTDSLGDTMWTRTYGGSYDDLGNSVAQTSDGGYIIAGIWDYNDTLGIADVYLIKVNSEADTIWTRTYGGSDDDWGSSVARTSDSGYIVAGGTFSFGEGGYDVYLIKTDSYGDIIWTRIYGGRDNDWANSVTQTSDGGYIVAGCTESFGADHADIYLIKTNSSGDTIWTRTYGGSNYDYGYSVAQTTDGGYIVAGYTESFGAGYADVYLIKTNLSGDTIWTRTYGGLSSDAGYSVAQTSDGGYIVTGGTSSFGAGSSDAYLLKTNSEGDTIWTRTYGGDGNDDGFFVAQHPDGSGYVIAGWTHSFGAWTPDYSNVYLIKTDSLGLTGIEERDTPKPQALSIIANPNPFNSSCEISVVGAYGIRPNDMRIEIFDLCGRCVSSLTLGPSPDKRERDDSVSFSHSMGEGVPTESGRMREYIWCPDKSISSGIYFIRVKIGEQTITKRVVLIR